MKISVLTASIILSLAITAGLALAFRPTGNAPSGESAVVRDRLDAMASSLTQLTDRLSALERAVRSARPNALASSEADHKPQAEAQSDAREAPTEEPPTLVRNGEGTEETDAQVAALLSGLGGDGEKALRTLVNRWIGEERTARQNQQAEVFRNQAKEFEELGKGPYGRFNHRVNTLAKKLGLDASQAAAYHMQLEQYFQRYQELREAARAKDPDERKKAAEDRKALQDEFDALARNVLRREQREAYDQLPSHETSLATSEVAPFVLSVDGTDGEAMGGAVIQTVDVSSEGLNIEFLDLPLPVPAPTADQGTAPSVDQDTKTEE